MSVEEEAEILAPFKERAAKGELVSVSYFAQNYVIDFFYISDEMKC